MRSALFLVIMATAVIATRASSRPAGQAVNSADFRALSRAVTDDIERLAIPGAAVSVIRDGKVAFAQGFGVSRQGTLDAVHPATIFQIGSVTKIFTATAMVKLASVAMLDLSAPVGRYEPHATAEIRALTLRQLLTHTAGLKDEAPYFGAGEESALRDTISQWGSDFIFTTPEAIYSYSNPGYAILGAVIESVSGMPFADAMEKLVFAPLGMEHTSVRPVPAGVGVAAGHIVRDGETVALGRNANNVVYWPAGYISSTALDVSRFKICLLENGRLDGRQVLPADILDRLTSASVQVPGRPSRYGYGIGVSGIGDARVLSHDGSIVGFAARMVLVPERHYGLVALSNKHQAFLSTTAETALRRAVQDHSVSAAPATRSAESTGDVVGFYRQGNTTLEVLVQDDELTLGYEGRKAALVALGEDRFRYVLSDGEAPSELVFVRADGSVRYLHTRGRAYLRQR
jgi:CubicO group peptidase (beta-lactamase class C family)